ncbi:hypothetical protein FAM09_24880 [Niastella caeni]|uniref:Uncharacterized protein n=1 Tax=Niastella caeni TaxID=2569763 RepID=A0A4S8HGU4_9BACT|nr:hypothetical protein [Niastella caeni]THU34257.1 hypothetical protein FAM09_24880 [Niastella caeni]
MPSTSTITIPLFMVKPGTWVIFPHRPRKKFLVRDHHHTYIRMRPGLVNDYADGRNFDQLPGTRLKDSSGRTYVVDSSKFVIER